MQTIDSRRPLDVMPVTGQQSNTEHLQGLLTMRIINLFFSSLWAHFYESQNPVLITFNDKIVLRRTGLVVFMLLFRKFFLIIKLMYFSLNSNMKQEKQSFWENICSVITTFCWFTLILKLILLDGKFIICRAKYFKIFN